MQLQNLLNQDDETSHQRIEQEIHEPFIKAIIKYSPEMAYNRDPISILTHVMRGEIFTEVDQIVRRSLRDARYVEVETVSVSDT
jgi:hypothetical protein